MRRIDPRIYQISILTSLLIFGIARLEFEVTPVRAALVLFASILTQWLCSWLWQLPFEWKSSPISGLSMCLLLRTESPLLHILAATLAVTSKFMLRARGKHIFNPTNIAIVALLVATDRVWISPGQWGSQAFFAFLMACAGGLVVNRAVRSDVTYAFIISYFLLVFGRALWLGDPLEIPMHKFQSGALLLFAFFMISDPKTTPDTRWGRIAFALIVATGGWYLQWKYWMPEGLLYSLAFFSLFIPVIDLLSRGKRYEWQQGQPLAASGLRLSAFSFRIFYKRRTS